MDISSSEVEPDGDSWETAFTEIQAGLDATEAALTSSTADDCSVWVAAGTYRPYKSYASDTIQLKSNVYLYGGFEGIETSLSQRNLADNKATLHGGGDVWHVVTGSPNSYIDGFRIYGGDCLESNNNSLGAGIYQSGGKLTIKNCIFSYNYAVGGGGIAIDNGTLEMENVLMYKNYGSFIGHAILLDNNSIGSIVNCTIVDHNLLIDGHGYGAIYADEGETLIRNTILWGNEDGVLVGYQPNYDIAYSVIEGGYIFGGSYLYDDDPQFVSAYNYDITYFSICVDAASSFYAPPYDIEGKSRYDIPNDGMVADIGAYEFRPNSL